MLVSLEVLMRLFVWFKGDIILAGSFGVDKAEWQTGVAPCQMRQCVGLIGKRLYDLWYNDIYKFEESLDFFQTNLHKKNRK